MKLNELKTLSLSAILILIVFLPSCKQPDSAHPFVQNHYVVVVHLKFVNLANECVADSLKGNDFLKISYLVNIENFIGFRDIDFRNDFSISRSLLPTVPTGREKKKIELAL